MHKQLKFCTESFPPINPPVGSIDEFSITLSWQLSDEDAHLLDRVTISYQWVSLLEDNSQKRQATSVRSSMVTIDDPSVTQHTITNLQPYSNYCFTVAAHYAFDGQALGVAEAQQFCTDTSEASELSLPNIHFYTAGSSSIHSIKPDGDIKGSNVHYFDMEYTTITQWCYNTLHSK